MKQEYKRLPVSCIRPSPFNHRRPSDQAVREMADTILEAGDVLQAIKVRPIEPIIQPDLVTMYELVFGETRWRGAQLAGLEDIQAVIEDMNDTQVKLQQLIENTQRTDPRPIEEARGIKSLLDEPASRYTVDSLVQVLGKGRSHIYNRLRLLKLQGKALEAVESGLIGADIGALIGALPGQLQAKALELSVTSVEGKPQARSVRDAKRLIQNELMIPIEDATFDIMADLAKKPTCDVCPSRSCNDPVLKDEISSDVCTDTECFRLKERTQGLLTAQAAREAGRNVIEGDAAKEAYAGHGDYFTGLTNLMAPMGGAHPDSKYSMTWQEAVEQCKAEGHLVPETTVVVHPRSGVAIETLTADDRNIIVTALRQIIAKAGPPPSTAAQAHKVAPSKWQAEQAALLEAMTPTQRAVHNHWRLVRKAMMQRACGTERTVQDLRLIAQSMVHYETITDDMAEALGWSEVRDLFFADRDAATHARLEAADPDELARFMVVLAIEICDNPDSNANTLEDAAYRVDLAECYGVDVLAVTPQEVTDDGACGTSRDQDEESDDE